MADFVRNAAVPTLVKMRWTGKQRLTDTYRYLNHLPLRDSDELDGLAPAPRQPRTQPDTG